MPQALRTRWGDLSSPDVSEAEQMPPPAMSGDSKGSQGAGGAAKPPQQEDPTHTPPPPRTEGREGTRTRGKRGGRGRVRGRQPPQQQLKEEARTTEQPPQQTATAQTSDKRCSTQLLLQSPEAPSKVFLLAAQSLCQCGSCTARCTVQDPPSYWTDEAGVDHRCLVQQLRNLNTHPVDQLSLQLELQQECKCSSCRVGKPV